MTVKTLPITPAIEINGQSYTEIRLREPVLADFVAMARKIGDELNEETLYLGEIELVRAVSGLPGEVIDRLRADLLDTARDYLTGFEQAAREDVEKLRNEWGDTLPPSYTVDLGQPINATGRDFVSLDLTPPTVGPVRRARAFLKKQTVLNLLLHDQVLLEAVSGWPKAAILSLPISKKIAASGYLESFLFAGQKTGSTSQQT